MTLRSLIATGLLLASATCLAEGWDFAGTLSAELRVFPDNPLFSDQNDHAVSPSVAGEPEIVYEWNQNQDRLTLVPFARWDADDDERSHTDLREAHWLHIADSYDVLLGVGKIFWGVTESRHLVDIVNQTDGVEDIDGEDKLGQPMLRLNWLSEWGTFSAFVLPGFRERTFPADDARLRGALPIDGDNPTYESDDGDDHVDIAMRWAHTLGQWDIGVSYFDGTSREPLLRTGQRDGRTVLIPHYQLIDQTGIDIQYTGEATLWKLEMISRGGQGKRFFAAVGGIEYTFYSVAQSKADLGVLLEYQYDDRGPGAPPTTADDDIFLGARLTLNDVSDTTFLAGAIIDRHTHATFYSVEAERRISNHWKAELEGRFISNVPAEDILYQFRNDDFVTVRLVYSL